MTSRTSKRVPRTRNAGTLTEAAFFSWLRTVLRRASLAWKPKRAALKKQATGGRIGRAQAYACASCGAVHKEKELEADHISPCGSLRGWEDLPRFASRLFVEEDGWQWLCKDCHADKTKRERGANL